jgi:hypothetical protein
VEKKELKGLKAEFRGLVNGDAFDRKWAYVERTLQLRVQAQFTKMGKGPPFYTNQK